jgi:hypothetical protein
LDLGITSPISNGRAALGYIAVFCSLFTYYETDLLKKRLPLALTVFAGGLLWSFSSGHARYGIMLEVLSSIYFLIWLFDLYTLKRHLLREIFTYLLATSVLIAAFFSHQSYYSWRPTPLLPSWTIIETGGGLADLSNAALYQEQLDLYATMAGENIPFIGRDRRLTSDPALAQKLASVKTWLCFEPLTKGALMIMANPKADFIFLYKEEEGQGSFYRGGLYQYIREILPSYDETSLYAIVDTSGIGWVGVFFSYFFGDFAAAGLAIVECEPIELEITYKNQPHLLIRLMTVETAEGLGYVPLTLDDILNASQ